MRERKEPIRKTAQKIQKTARANYSLGLQALKSVVNVKALAANGLLGD